MSERGKTEKGGGGGDNDFPKNYSPTHLLFSLRTPILHNPPFVPAEMHRRPLHWHGVPGWYRHGVEECVQLQHERVGDEILTCETLFLLCTCREGGKGRERERERGGGGGRERN